MQRPFKKNRFRPLFPFTGKGDCLAAKLRPGDVENRIKEGMNTLCRNKTSRHRFEADQAGLLRGALADHLLHLFRVFHLQGEEVGRSIEWIVQLIEAGAKVAYQEFRRQVNGAGAFL